MSNPPSISVQLAIDPPQFIRGSPPMPTLSVTATSHATEPITIFTPGTIFNLNQAQKRRNFTCLDLTANTPIQMEITKGGKRVAYRRAFGHHDERFFWTLDPEVSVTFTDSFMPRVHQPPPNTFPAHQYRLGVSDEEVVSWWRHGRKEEVLAPAGTTASLDEPSGPPIQLMPVAPVDFEIKESSTG